MKNPIIAANWKMNLHRESACDLSRILVDKFSDIGTVDILLFPPYVYLSDVAKITYNSKIKIGGQNICFEKSGAFTGEISAFQLKDIGCTHALIGHSERRHYFQEDYETISKKVKIALSYDLQIILCVGESLEEKTQNLTEMVVTDQICSALKDVPINQIQNITIAYEPIWAIGTGQTAMPEETNHVHVSIREAIDTVFKASASSQIRILYGGSVTADNIQQFLRQEYIDGSLIGGASLQAKSFTSIIEKNL